MCVREREREREERKGEEREKEREKDRERGCERERETEIGTELERGREGGGFRVQGAGCMVQGAGCTVLLVASWVEQCAHSREIAVNLYTQQSYIKCLSMQNGQLTKFRTRFFLYH